MNNSFVAIGIIGYFLVDKNGEMNGVVVGIDILFEKQGSIEGTSGETVNSKVAVDVGVKSGFFNKYIGQDDMSALLFYLRFSNKAKKS